MYKTIPQLVKKQAQCFIEGDLPINQLPIMESAFADPDLLDVQKYLLQYKQTGDIIAGFDHYIMYTLPKQLAACRIPYQRGDDELDCTFRMTSVTKPRYRDHENKEQPLYPTYARNTKRNYIASVWGVRVGYRRGTKIEYEVGANRELFRILSMVHSVACNLSTIKDRQDLLHLGENPDDPGGYFIYNGNISIIPGIEKLRINRFFIFPPNKDTHRPQARQTINVPTGTGINNVIEREVDGSSFVKACHFSVPKMGTAKTGTGAKRYKGKNSINVLQLIDIINHNFRRWELLIKPGGRHHAIDIILSFICTEDPELREKQRRDVFRELSGTIFEYEEGASTGQKMEELLTWIDVDPQRSTDRDKWEAIKNFIQVHVFGSTLIHLGEIDQDEEGKPIMGYLVEPKINLICMLTCYYLLFKTGHETYTNRDDWANKRIDTAVVSLSQAFWTSYQYYMKNVAAKLEQKRSTNVTNIDSLFQVGSDANAMNRLLTNALLEPFNKKAEEGTTGSAFEPSQKINPTNLIDLISAITKVQVKVDKKVKSRGVRSIQGSQYGYICPAKTPDGIRCGMVKNKAILMHVTLEEEIAIVIANFRKLGLVAQEQSEQNFNVFIVNHQILGFCNGPSTYEILRRMRQGSPDAFSLLQKDDQIFIEPTWYDFDTERKLELILAELGTDIRTDEEAQIDGWKYLLHFKYADSGFVELGYVTKEVVDKLIFESSLPSIPEDTTFMLNQFGHLCVYTDAGRPSRAVYVVRDNTRYLEKVGGKIPKLELLIDNPLYETDKLSFSELEKRGFVDYVDPYEESSPNFLQAVDKIDFYEKLKKEAEVESDLNNLRATYSLAEEELLNSGEENYESIRRRLSVLGAEISMRENLLLQSKRAPVRYVSFHGVAIYGIAAASAPVSQFDPAGKTSHTAKTIPQTLGLQSNAYAHRKEVAQEASNIPLTTPSITAFFGDRRAFLGRDVPFGLFDMPGNQEDAVLFSSLLIECGFMQYKRQFTITMDISIADANAEYLGVPDTFSELERIPYRHLTADGLPPIGYVLKEKDVAMCKYIVDVNRNMKQPSPVYVEQGEGGKVVDIIFRPVLPKETEPETVNKIQISLLIEAVLVPEIGDKFSLMHGQKSVIGGRFVPFEDMMVSSLTGTSPLVLFNTHAMKNRQTLGVSLETILGLRAAIFSKAYDTTGFVPYTLDNIVRELAEAGHGFNRTIFYDGRTGQSRRGYMYMGHVRLQQLHHFANLKINANNFAEVDAATGQKKKGNQKYGEMEKDVIIAYGMHQYFQEKFNRRADNYQINSCSACEIFTNREEGKCPHCGAEGTLIKLELTYAYKHLQDIALMQGIRIHSAVGTDEEFAQYHLKSIKSKQDRETGGLQVFVSTNNEDELGFEAEQEAEEIDPFFNDEETFDMPEIQDMEEQ